MSVELSLKEVRKNINFFQEEKEILEIEITIEENSWTDGFNLSAKETIMKNYQNACENLNRYKTIESHLVELKKQKYFINMR